MLWGSESRDHNQIFCEEEESAAVCQDVSHHALCPVHRLKLRPIVTLQAGHSVFTDPHSHNQWEEQEEQQRWVQCPGEVGAAWLHKAPPVTPVRAGETSVLKAEAAGMCLCLASRWLLHRVNDTKSQVCHRGLILQSCLKLKAAECRRTAGLQRCFHPVTFCPLTPALPWTDQVVKGFV